MMEGLLTGWKAISHYLQVSERTARRYEHDQGLPVIRRSPNGLVRALKKDIDQWIITRDISA